MKCHFSIYIILDNTSLFLELQRSGMEQNAVTYGIYHQAVLKGGWPVGDRVEALKAWNRLAIVVRAVSLLKMNLSLAASRRSLQFGSVSVIGSV